MEYSLWVVSPCVDQHWRLQVHLESCAFTSASVGFFVCLSLVSSMDSPTGCCEKNGRWTDQHPNMKTNSNPFGHWHTS